MRKIRKLTFEELVNENKKELLKDEHFLNQIEDKLEQRYLEK
ncbi:FbpB family small basic protein [Metabacillus sp. RGM 3146]